MTSITNRWKLGLFVVSSIALGVATLLWLGASQLQREVEVYHVFVDEDISGLEVGSPVKFRGVTVGSVSEITIAPDRRAVRITIEVFTSVMRRIGLRKPDDREERAEELREQAIAMGLRAQLASAGITGGKFVQIDYFDLSRHATLQFSFELPPRTFPSVASTAKSLETVLYSLSALPEILDDVRNVLMNIEKVAASVDEEVRSLDLQSLVQSVQTQVDGLDTTALVARFRETLDRTDGLLADAQQLVGGLDQDREALATFVERAGVLRDTLEQILRDAEIPATSGSLREAAQAFTRTSDEAEALLGDAAATARDASSLAVASEAALRHLELTLDAVRDLAELLERDPGALLRGREQTIPPTRAP